jgi:hypothetical protein
MKKKKKKKIIIGKSSSILGSFSTIRASANVDMVAGFKRII